MSIVMKRNHIIILLLLITSGLNMSFTAPVKPAIEIVVIINATNPVEKLNAELVKNFWLRRFVKRWKETSKSILPADRKNKCIEQELFYNSVLGLAPDAVEAYLSARQYQTGDTPIQKFATDADIIGYVSREPGAIGYINASSLSKSETGVKVVLMLSK